MKLLVYTDNLFFLARLEGSLKQAKIDALCRSTLEQAITSVDGNIWGALVDLHAQGSFDLLNKLVAVNTPLAAFCGHAEVELRKKAKSAGVQILLANSDLVDNLPQALFALQSRASHTEPRGSFPGDRA